jgi:uncharacterized protein
MVVSLSDPLVSLPRRRFGDPPQRDAAHLQLPPNVNGPPQCGPLFYAHGPGPYAPVGPNGKRSLPMFENQKDQMEVMLKSNEAFRHLYNRHQQLEKRVLAAENGTAPMEDLALNQLKREKLHAKDQLTRMLEQAQAA